MKLAQGIICGPWALAISFDWASQIVERFELSAIPKAPGWLMGSANVEGNILPVVDLALYFSPEIPVSTAQRQQRILVAGVTKAGAEDALALLFSGLPQQLSYETEAMTYSQALPLKLREVCEGVALNIGGQNYLEINARKLVAALSDELAVL